MPRSEVGTWTSGDSCPSTIASASGEMNGLSLTQRGTYSPATVVPSRWYISSKRVASASSMSPSTVFAMIGRRPSVFVSSVKTIRTGSTIRCQRSGQTSTRKPVRTLVGSAISSRKRQGNWANGSSGIESQAQSESGRVNQNETQKTTIEMTASPRARNGNRLKKSQRDERAEAAEHHLDQAHLVGVLGRLGEDDPVDVDHPVRHDLLERREVVLVRDVEQPLQLDQVLLQHRREREVRRQGVGQQRGAEQHRGRADRAEHASTVARRCRAAAGSRSR